HASINQAKIANVDRKIVVAQPGNEPIEDASHRAKDDRFRSRPPHPIDDLVTCFPKPDKIENQLGGVLQITVDLHRGIAARETIACEDRALESEIARESINSHPVIAGGKPLEVFEGAITAAIIGEDKFPLIPIGNPRERLING